MQLYDKDKGMDKYENLLIVIWFLNSTFNSLIGFIGQKHKNNYNTMLFGAQ